MYSLRKFVITSHRRPVFRRFYDGIYNGGESLLGILGRLDPSIIGVFMRTSNDPGIPGLSDYDLTVTPKVASTSERLRFLGKFWHRYALLKRMLPMLGETDILPPRDLIDYILLGPGPTVARKRLTILFESFPPRWIVDFQEAFARQDDHVGENDLLREAILRHLLFVVPHGLEYILTRDPIQEIWLNHLTSKVHSVIQGTAPDPLKEPTSLYREFRGLSLTCRQLKINVRGEAPVLPRASSGPAVWPLLEPYLKCLSRSPAYPSPSMVLWRTSGSRNRFCLAVVIEDDLEESPFLTLIEDLARARRVSQGIWQKFFYSRPFQACFPLPPYPLYVSRSMWRSWMYLVPTEAAAVCAGGDLVAGDPSVLAEARPRLETLPRDISTRYAAMLSLRNNWRRLDPANRPRFYTMARDLVRDWRLALEGKPIFTEPESDADEPVDLHQGYEMLQKELMQLRPLLMDHDQ
jgi:hypothetical protein